MQEDSKRNGAVGVEGLYRVVRFVREQAE